MSFETQYDLSIDAIFLKKIRVAIATVAVLIAGEAVGSNTVEQWAKRGQLAINVLQNPTKWEAQFSIATVTNAVITSSSTDADIQFQVSAEWDDMAGVTGKNLV